MRRARQPRSAGAVWPRIVRTSSSCTASYSFPFGTQIGGNFYAGSGTPLTTYVNTLNGIEVFVEGRGDMGRTDMLNYTDLLLSQEVRLGGTQRLRFELNVLNVFNQKTSRHRLQLSEPRSRAQREIDLHSTNLAQGYDYNAMIRCDAGRRQRLRPALSTGRPVQPGDVGSLPGEVAVLSNH